MCKCVSVGRSKRIGPNTDSCGTPEVTWILSDVAPSSMTRCVRNIKNEFNQSSTILSCLCRNIEVSVQGVCGRLCRRLY